MATKSDQVVSVPGSWNAHRGVRATAWISAYLILAAFPLLVLLLGEMPKGGGYWWDFAMALGFGGLAIMGFGGGATGRVYGRTQSRSSVG